MPWNLLIDDHSDDAVGLRLDCHCAFPIYANVPVQDERGRYCGACGHYERAPQLALEAVAVGV